MVWAQSRGLHTARWSTGVSANMPSLVQVITVRVGVCSTSSSQSFLATMLPTYLTSPPSASEDQGTTSSMQLPPPVPSGDTASSRVGSETEGVDATSRQDMYTTQAPGSVLETTASTLEMPEPTSLPSYTSGENFTSPLGEIYLYQEDVAITGTTINAASYRLRERQSAGTGTDLAECVQQCDEIPVCVGLTLLGESCLLYSTVDSAVRLLGAQAAINEERLEALAVDSATSIGISTTTTTPMETPNTGVSTAPSSATSTALENGSSSGPSSAASSAEDSELPLESEAYSTPLLSTSHATSFVPPPPSTSVGSTVLPVILSIPPSTSIDTSSAMAAQSSLSPVPDTSTPLNPQTSDALASDFTTTHSMLEMDSSTSVGSPASSFDPSLFAPDSSSAYAGLVPMSGTSSSLSTILSTTGSTLSSTRTPQSYSSTTRAATSVGSSATSEPASLSISGSQAVSTPSSRSSSITASSISTSQSIRSIVSSSTTTSLRGSSTSSSSSRTTASPALPTTTSTTSTRSVIPSATPVRNTGKRGLCYTNGTLALPYSLEGQNSRVSWGYNYYYRRETGNSPNFNTDFNEALDFVPLLFNDNPGLTEVWPQYAQQAIDAGADTLLGFNEPDLCYPGSSCMSVNQSVDAWKKYMEPFAGKARLGAPAVTNGGPPSSLTWLGEFIANCTDCTIDFVPLHWYSNVYAFSYLQYYVQQAYNVTGKPIWITEFGIDGSGGSELQYQAFLKMALPWLDAVPYVERYAYFYDAPGYLINADGNGLSAQGMIYNSYTAPCPDWQNTEGKCT